MRIEVLFPEVANLYGELSNIEYVRRSCPSCEVTETSLLEKPVFLTEHVDLTYMGTMTEHSQEIVIKALSEYKEEIRESVESGKAFLITGNALEVFGKKIEDVDGTVVEGLGIFDFHTTRDMLHRFNSLYLGQYEDIEVAGYKSQFTQSYYDKDYDPMFRTIRGPGFGPGLENEGIRYKNFMASYVIGPLFILNPRLMTRILSELGSGEVKPAFEKQAMEAYEARIAEYSDPKCGFTY